MGQTPLEPTKAKQVSRLGETPAEARAKMSRTEGVQAEVEQPVGTEVKGPLTPQHLAAIEAEEGGFKDTAVKDGPVEDVPETAEAPTPEKAMAVIRQLSQEKNQLQAELDAALNLIQRYRGIAGDLD